MQPLHFDELALECRHGGPWQHRHAILLALPVAHDDLMTGDIHIFHPQAETFHQAESSAIEETGHQMGYADEMDQAPGDSLPCKHDGHL